MGKIQVFTGIKSTSEPILGSVVVDGVVGSPENVFASSDDLFVLREEALLKDHLSATGGALVDFCIRIDGGNASNSICHLEAPSTTPVLPSILSGTSGDGSGTGDGTGTGMVLEQETELVLVMVLELEMVLERVTELVLVMVLEQALETALDLMELVLGWYWYWYWYWIWRWIW